MDEVLAEIRFDGQRYGYWQKVDIRESVDDLCASVRLAITRPGTGDSLGLTANTVADVLIGDGLVTKVRPDSVRRKVDADSHAIYIEARSLGRELVDCQYSKTLSGLKLGEIVKRICSTFKVPVKIEVETAVVADVEYDGADMVILDPLPASKAPLVTAAKRLDVRSSFANPNYQYQIQADEIVVKDAAGNSVLLTNVLANGDITVAGANGLDTGAEAANAWYAIWLIYNSTTQTYASLLSTNGTNPMMPAGYTYKALVSYVRNNATSNFLAFHQRGDLYQYKSPIAVLSAGTATVVTAIDIGSVVPGDAKSVMLFLSKQTPASVGQSTGIVCAGPAGATTAYLGALAYSGGNAQSGYSNGELMLEWAEYQANIYYQNTGGSGSMTVNVNGFRLSGICSY